MGALFQSHRENKVRVTCKGFRQEAGSVHDDIILVHARFTREYGSAGIHRVARDGMSSCAFNGHVRACTEASQHKLSQW